MQLKFQFLNKRSYLLALDNGASCFTSNKVAEFLNQDPIKFTNKYDNGNFSDSKLDCKKKKIIKINFKGAIFCKRPVRRLEV